MGGEHVMGRTRAVCPFWAHLFRRVAITVIDVGPTNHPSCQCWQVPPLCCKRGWPHGVMFVLSCVTLPTPNLAPPPSGGWRSVFIPKTHQAVFCLQFYFSIINTMGFHGRAHMSPIFPPIGFLSFLPKRERERKKENGLMCFEFYADKSPRFSGARVAAQCSVQDSARSVCGCWSGRTCCRMSPSTTRSTN